MKLLCFLDIDGTNPFNIAFPMAIVGFIIGVSGSIMGVSG
jgi:hypothetical protein